MKKQEEVSEKKRLPQNKLENFKPVSHHKSENVNIKTVKKSLMDNLKAVDTEELEACRKSRYIEIYFSFLLCCGILKIVS